jgi:phosphoribosylformylglycinamidine cyclo-ligase
MGCGFVAIVPSAHAAQAVSLLGQRHPGARRIGSVTERGGLVER